jgi:hypothetical protein
MGKRSNYKRLVGDRYMTTDRRPVLRLQPFLRGGVTYAEPCAGNGDLIRHLTFYGHTCAYACDVKPGRKTIEKRDAFTLDRRWRRSTRANVFITNPPWTREILHPLIDHLTSLLPLWILLDADWMHTDQAAPYIDRCGLIVSAGRVKWIASSTGQGVDNSAWYYFPHRLHKGGPRFVGLT